MARPAVGCAHESSSLTNVVLPAPFGPRSPNVEPRSTLSVIPSTARTSLPVQRFRNILIRPFASTAQVIRWGERRNCYTGSLYYGRMRIDAHQHFWDIQRFNYPWMPAESPLRRNFLPNQLETILQRNRFDGSVVVQANVIIEETRWLLDLALQHDFIRGVVGWVDLTDPRLGQTLDQLGRHAKFKGVRHLVHDE